MAQVIIRPSTDISISNVGLSSGSYAYSLINEVSQDGDSTYVSYATAGATITVRCSTPDISRIKTINSITVYAVYRGNGYQDGISFGFRAPVSGGTSFSNNTNGSYNMMSYTIQVNKPIDQFDLTNVRIYYEMYSYSDIKSMHYLTQMYVVIDYVEKKISYIKIGGSWKGIVSVYVKTNGTWRLTRGINGKINGAWRSD